MNILLVDDEPIIHRAVGRFLSRYGHELKTATEAGQALQLLDEECPDLVISDIKMPGMNGLELLEKLKVRAPTVPVVLITGHGDTDTAISALHKGAYSYLRKPVKLEELIAILERIEMRKQLEKSLASISRAPVPRKRRPTTWPFRPARFLVVASNAASLDQIGEVLQHLGHSCVVCPTAEEGIEAFENGLFDIVFTEVELPQMDGIEMVRRLTEREPGLVSIVTTAHRDQDIAVRALESGARFFLPKPFSAAEFEDKLSAALKERENKQGQHHLLEDLIKTRTELQETLLQQNQRLSRTERHLHDLLDAVPFGILSTDMSGVILTCNSTAETMYGLSAEEMIGQDIATLLGEANSPMPARAVHQRRDDSHFPVLIHRCDIIDAERNSSARLYVVEDLSERQQLEEQLLQAQRLSLLGELAPRIAHEVKTPLQLITGYAELAMQWLDGNNSVKSRSCMELILPAAQQMQDMVQQISNLGKPAECRMETLDLRRTLDQLLSSLEHLKLIKHCQVVRDFPEDLPGIEADPSQIEQLFRNLIVNATQAMEETSQRILHLALHVSATGDQVEVAVCDTGTGIEPDFLEHIFHPFATTKAEGEGTGLGLAIVKTIVERHRGTIRVETEKGKGSSFYLSFPTVPPRQPVVE